jgi:hypothetical protein
MEYFAITLSPGLHARIALPTQSSVVQQSFGIVGWALLQAARQHGSVFYGHASSLG